MLLEIKNLDCRRGHKLVVADVTFSLKSGECIILKGPNGSGKTTLLRHIAGLNSNNINNLSNDEIAFSGHLDGVKSTLTVNENLKFWNFDANQSIIVNSVTNISELYSQKLSENYAKRGDYIVGDKQIEKEMTECSEQEKFLDSAFGK